MCYTQKLAVATGDRAVFFSDRKQATGLTFFKSKADFFSNRKEWTRADFFSNTIKNTELLSLPFLLFFWYGSNAVKNNELSLPFFELRQYHGEDNIMVKMIHGEDDTC